MVFLTALDLTGKRRSTFRPRQASTKKNLQKLK